MHVCSYEHISYFTNLFDVLLLRQAFLSSVSPGRLLQHEAQVAVAFIHF